MPEGRLDSFQRHKLRVFGIYSQPLGRFGSLDLSPIWRVNSGRVYSLTAGDGGAGGAARAQPRLSDERHQSGRSRDRLLRRPRCVSVQGLRSRRPGGHLCNTRVDVGVALVQARDLQRAEQPEADRVGSHGDRRSRRARWTPTAFRPAISRARVSDRRPTTTSSRSRTPDRTVAGRCASRSARGFDHESRRARSKKHYFVLFFFVSFVAFVVNPVFVP